MVVPVLAFTRGDGWCSGPFLLELEGQTMSLEADRVPLRVVLYRLQEEGVAVYADPRIDPFVSASFSDLPLEQALALILRPYSYGIVWEQAQSGVSDALRPVELRLFEKGAEGRVMPLRAGAGVNLEIDQTGDRSFVRNRLLIKLAAGADEAALEEVLAGFGARLAGPPNALGVVRVELPESITPQQAAAMLAGAAGIAAAEPDYAYRLPAEVLTPVKPATADPKQGEASSASPLVAVLDSGLDGSYKTDNFVSSFYDALSRRSEAVDPVGHGTQMTLLAAGVVQPLGVRGDGGAYHQVVAVRAFDDNGFTSNHTLMEAVEFALGEGARVISMSWGTDQPSDMLGSLIDYAASRGAIMVGAAGNTPSGELVYPAAYDRVIGVGALNPDGSVWERSNYGTSVSAWAPGVLMSGDEDTGQVNIYAGTSVSTAHLAYKIAEKLKN